MKVIWYIIFYFILIGNLYGQGQEMAEGKISYISSQNIYVRFESTSGICVGDTLFLAEAGRIVPLIIVKNLSSTSCMGIPFPGQTLHLSDPVKAVRRPQPENNRLAEKKPIQEKVSEESVDTAGTGTKSSTVKLREQEIKGSISIASYSQFSNTNTPSAQRFRYQIALNVTHIGGSRFSAESQISFRHRIGEWELIRNNVFYGLKIYNLCLRYDLSPKTVITFGRRINPLISNMGAVDGLQADFTFRNFSAGLLAGSRPSFKDYSPDLTLMQFGGYFAHRYKNKSGIMQSSIALVEQTNAMKTDRRFLYFQHTNSLIRQINFFSSFELDLYQKINNKSTQNPTLSGLFVSIRYAPVKRLSLFATYDARKNIIYYESYKNFISTLIDTALRQGASLQINYRPYPFLYTGIKGGMRFQRKDPSPSDNLYGFVTYSGMSQLNFSTTLSSTLIETSYLHGMIYAINSSISPIPGKCFLGIGYQYLDYKISESGLPQYQQLASMNLNWRFTRKTSLSVNYEIAMEGSSRSNSIQVQFRQGFR
jgi:hypothetical protein